ncbi:AbiV family abortive infection protein [Bacillus cereus group sp. TH150LC]|uniref:AbiV family abortive infection protein n=1 Tax=Bacillus cereus group sp. TH150LC TaxID=3018061 RepID=UPI0022E5907A|nr:AbiV family abortive infection protein [Bacillus cereus group sp. TH150LC]MDA1657929.1 AbiV family abortive infection protein [Bacillus cereus group sp. TH150LC]
MNQLKIEQLQTAYTKIFDNARELINESTLLFENGSKTRAFTLAHLACEELAKLPIVYYTATKVYFKKPVDWKKFKNRFQDHKEKIRMLISLILIINEQTINDEKVELIEEFVKVANDLKNQSLYTGFYDNKFQQPCECVSDESVDFSRELATTALNFFTAKEYYKPNGILNSLKATSVERFEQLKDVANHNSYYTKDGEILRYYAKKQRNELKLKQKQRNQKLRKKKKK